MQLASLADFVCTKRPTPRGPEVLFVLSTNETFEVDAPDDFIGLHEVQSRKRNGDSGGPSLRGNACLGYPNAVPTGVPIAAVILRRLFVSNQSIALRAERIELKHVSVAAVVRRIDHNFKVVVEFLTHIPAQLRGNNFPRFGIVTRNSEVDLAFRIEDAHFGALRWGLSFVWFSLCEVSDWFSKFPQRVINRAIHSWRMVYSHRIRDAKWLRGHGCLRLTEKSSC